MHCSGRYSVGQLFLVQRKSKAEYCSNGETLSDFEDQEEVMYKQL